MMNRNLSHVSLSALATAIFAMTSPASAALVNRYSFSETGGIGTTLVDSVSANNATITDVGANNGTVGGGQVTLAGGPKGASDYVTLGSNLLNVHSDATIEMWGTQNAVQNWGRLFSFGSSTTNNLFMSWTRGTTLTQDRAGFKIGGSESRISDSMAPYALGTEYYVAMVIDDDGGAGTDTRVSLYLDSVFQGSFDTTYNLNQLVETENTLGRAKYPDNVASASWNEFRIHDVALSELSISENFAGTADEATGSISTAPFVPSPAPTPQATPSGAIADWQFARTDGSSDAVSDGDLISNSNGAAANLNDDAAAGGLQTGNGWNTPSYATYATSELAAFAGGGDGYALNTGPGNGGTDGNVYFSTGGAPLTTNDTFTFWARTKWTNNSGNDQVLISRPGVPNRYRLYLDGSGNLLTLFGGVTQDTGFDWVVGDWHDVAVVYSGIGVAGSDLLEVYVDGLSLGTFDAGTFDTADLFHIGADGGGGLAYDGLFDRVIFWDSVVSASAIAALTNVIPTPAALPAGLALLGLGAMRRRRK